jgi:hypothetical protein
MKHITYVNVHGHPVDPNHLPREAPKAKAKPLKREAPKAKAKPLKRVTDADKATQHLGFEVVGVSADRLRKALVDYEDAAKRAAAAGRPIMATFDEQAWLAKQNPRRAIARVYSVPDAAEQAAGMLRAQGGWLAVRVVEILKG